MPAAGWIGPELRPCAAADMIWEENPGGPLSVQVEALVQADAPVKLGVGFPVSGRAAEPMRTPPKRAPYRSREAGTVRDLSAGCGRPDTRQLADCITLIERFEENAPSRLLARHPGCAGCRCRTPNWAFCARHLRPGIQDRGALLMVMEGGACAHQGRRLLSAGGGSGAGYRAAGRVARCRTKCPASAQAPVITPTAVTARAHPYLPERPGPVCRRSGCC